MKIFGLFLALAILASVTSAFTIASIFGGDSTQEELNPSGEVDHSLAEIDSSKENDNPSEEIDFSSEEADDASEENDASSEDTSDEKKLLHKLKKKHKPLKHFKKPFKLIKPTKPEIFKPKPVKPIKPIKKPIKPIKPIKKPIKPIKKPIKPIKPIKKPVKPIKPIKKPVVPTKPLKKPFKPLKPIKKPSIFSHLKLPSLPSLSFKLPQKIHNKKKIRPTKTEYVEVTKTEVVHPVCYITLKPKKPCIKKQIHGDDLGDKADNEENYHMEVEVSEDMGEIGESDTELEESQEGTQREAKELEEINYADEEQADEPISEENAESEQEGVEERTDFDAEQADEPLEEESVEEYSYEVEGSEGDRQGRYIDFGEEIPEQEETEEEYVEDDTQLEPSDDPESRIKKLKEQVTKTILVTRIEKYTDNHVTATVIAKNCAPVNPHVPKCKKKHGAAVIRERPDGDSPLIIATAVQAPEPPEITYDAKEIVNQDVDDIPVEEPAEEGKTNLEETNEEEQNQEEENVDEKKVNDEVVTENIPLEASQNETKVEKEQP